MVSASASERFLDSHWLSAMNPASRRAVLDVLIEKKADGGAVLLEQDHPNDHMSFLIEGSAAIERLSGKRPPTLLATLKAPVLFGMTSFFRPHPPSFQVRALSPVWYLTLDRPAHDRLRRADPHAAEQLALTVVRTLSDYIDQLDQRITDDLALNPQNGRKVNEWASFRSRLFEESSL